MERRLQEISEEDDGLRASDGAGDVDALPLVQEGGPDPIPGSGERDSDGQGIFEDVDISMFSPRLRARFERQEEEERHLTGEQRDALARSLADGRVVFGADMREYTSFGTGGIAEALAKADDVDALRAVVSRDRKSVV